MKNHLDQCVDVQVLLNIASFSNDINIGDADNRKSRINFAIDNTNIIDCYKNFKIILFEEAFN